MSDSRLLIVGIRLTSGMEMTNDLVQRAFMRVTKIGKTKTNPCRRGGGSRQQTQERKIGSLFKFIQN